MAVCLCGGRVCVCLAHCHISNTQDGFHKWFLTHGRVLAAHRSWSTWFPLPRQAVTCAGPDTGFRGSEDEGSIEWGISSSLIDEEGAGVATWGWGWDIGFGVGGRWGCSVPPGWQMELL